MAVLPLPARAGQHGLVVVETSDPTQDLHELTGWAIQRGTLLAGLTVNRPSLEDVYLRLTSNGVPMGAPERTTR